MSQSLRHYQPKPRPVAITGEHVQTSFGAGIIQGIRWNAKDGCWRYIVRTDDGAIINCGKVTLL